VVETHLDSDDPKAALAAAKYVLQGTQLLGETELHYKWSTTPKTVVLEDLRREARIELAPKLMRSIIRKIMMFDLDLYEPIRSRMSVRLLAQRRLKKALAEAGLAMRLE